MVYILLTPADLSIVHGLPQLTVVAQLAVVFQKIKCGVVSNYVAQAADLLIGEKHINLEIDNRNDVVRDYVKQSSLNAGQRPAGLD